ncbi:hypothetical protein OHA25_09970 [Nonomuraea sp. NBC_00507]|uniref:hypothetical protein n=1 Tax=Nonomuraea sp. NBC_00507 TaxID=2976002 RepID=UPI002E16E513
MSARERTQVKKKTSVVTGAIVAAAAAVTLATPAQAGAGSAQGPNPYKPHAVCASGYTFVKRVDIRTADVYLIWNRQKNTNCVVTLKKKDVGTPTPVTASLYVRATGALRLGNASHLETCVFWAGSTSHDVDPGAWIHCNPRPRD